MENSKHLVDEKLLGHKASWALVLIPLISICFYGVAGEDKFLLLSPLIILGYGCAFVWNIRNALSRRSPLVLPPSFVMWLVFICYGWMIAFNAKIPFEAEIRMLIVSLTIGLFYIWSNTFGLFRQSRGALGLLLLFALLSSFYGLVNFFKQPEMVLWVERWALYEGRLASTYICPNHFGHLLQMLLPFCFVLLFIPKAGILLRVLAGYCLVVFPVAIYFTESRASMLGSIAALGVTILLLALRKNKKLFVLLLIVVPLGASILLVGAWNFSDMFKRRMTPVVEFVLEAATEGFDNTSTRDFRPLTWLDSLDMVAAKPVTGFGPGSYRYTFPEYRNRFRGQGVVTGHPHNEYLEVASEYGLVGLGLFALAWCYGLIRILFFSIRTSNEHHAFIGMAFLGAAAGTMLHSFFDFQMHVFQNAMIFSLLAGITVGPICARKSELACSRWVQRSRWVSAVGLSVAALALLLFSAGVFSSAFLRSAADHYVEIGNEEKAIPLYKMSIRINKTNWRAYLGLGNLYAHDRRYTLEPELKLKIAETEHDVLSTGIKYNQLSPKLALALAKVESHLGNRDKAVGLLKRATKMRPFNDGYWWFLGVELRKSGRYEEALSTFHTMETIKRTQSSRANIKWLERKLSSAYVGNAESSAVSITVPIIDMNAEPSENKSLDQLFEIMEYK